MTGEHWKIGELARIAGVTVRTLHHYDSLGLLRPSERSAGGHRLYSEADVQRLYRLLALRGVGLPLEEIGPLLDREDGLADTVHRHLGRVEKQLGALEELRRRRADRDVHGRRPGVPGLAAADVRAGGPGEVLARHGLARGLRVHERDP